MACASDWSRMRRLFARDLMAQELGVLVLIKRGVPC
jgi:hypothetical protein